MDLRHISIYEGKVIQNIEIHLSNMQTLLAAILLKLSIHTEDVIVSEEKFSSNLILKLIDLMSSYCNQMSETLISLKSKESLKKFEQKMKIDKYLRIFAGAGIFAIGGFILFKFLKP